MKKRIIIWSVVYYLLIPCIFLGGWLLLELLPSDENPSLGEAGAGIIAVLFMTMGVLCVLMRFSLLKWYVDPFAAAELPLCLYIWMIYKEMDRWGVGLGEAFANVNESMCHDSIVEGWKILAGLFVIGLVLSFSVGRKRGDSIGYWWITPSEPQPE